VRALTPLLAASTLFVVAPRLAAQSDAPDCVAIVAEMLTPTPSAGAIRASAGCPSSGPVTLASRWTRRGPRSAAERSALVEASTWMHDARLYDAVSSVVRDGSYPTTDRLAGMRVLVAYSGESFMVSQQGQARDAKAPAADVAAKSAAASTTGSVAPKSTVRADIKRELTRLASEDRDPDVRYAAQKASESLGYLAPPKAKVARYRAP
jgi:hypothetical protein